jgi:alpha-methylacyl-CoA racemase
MLEEAFASKTRDEWEAIFALTDACVTPVLDYVEAASHPVNAERKAMLQDGQWLHPQIAPRLATQSPAAEFVIATCGGDYAAVLAEAGLSDDAVGALVGAGAVVVG